MTRAIRIPRVIVLQMYDRLPRTKVRFSRLNIYARDDNTCQYCAQKLPRTMLNLDHVIPRAKGGRTTWENVVCCCVPCNLKKGAKLAHDAGMKLLKKPERPRWNPTFRAPGGKHRLPRVAAVPQRRRRQLLEHRAHRRGLAPRSNFPRCDRVVQVV